MSRVRRSPGHVDVDLLQVRLRMEEQKYNRIEVTVRRSQPSEDNNNLLVKIGNYDSEPRKLKKNISKLGRSQPHKTFIPY